MARSATVVEDRLVIWQIGFQLADYLFAIPIGEVSFGEARLEVLESLSLLLGPVKFRIFGISLSWHHILLR